MFDYKLRPIFSGTFFIKRVLVTDVGASSSGKTPDFGSGIRRFESFCPSHFFIDMWRKLWKLLSSQLKRENRAKKV